jgi:anti-sigma factor RsiW
MMLTHDEVQARLSAFHDGDLPDVERKAVEGHLARCDDCLVELAAIGELIERAGALPRSMAPPRDLWPGIAARVGAGAGTATSGEAAAGVVPLEPRRLRASLVPVWVLRLAAAVTLVVISSGVTAWVLRPTPSSPVASVPVEAAGEGPGVSQIGFASTEAAYEGAAEGLERQLNARRHLLSPETIATVEENLGIIDRAIAEASAALEADPGNPQLPLILSGVYRQKVQLLRTAVQLSQNS